MKIPNPRRVGGGVANPGKAHSPLGSGHRATAGGRMVIPDPRRVGGGVANYRPYVPAVPTKEASKGPQSSAAEEAAGNEREERRVGEGGKTRAGAEAPKYPTD